MADRPEFMRFFREVFFAVAWPVSRRAACLCLLGALAVLPLGAADPAVEEPPQKPSPEAVEAVEALKLPGLTINLEEKSVDVDATVCLRTGFLELVACTKGSKEHESIISVDAKPSHIHAALLLLGAKPGNPGRTFRPAPRRGRPRTQP